MDKRAINKEQFRKLVISEAKKFMAEDNSAIEIKSTLSESKEIKPERKKRKSLSDIESLISEINKMPKSISEIKINDDEIFSIMESVEIGAESKKPNRDLDVIEHNREKNILHVNESERQKWDRMLKYDIPSDDKRL